MKITEKEILELFKKSKGRQKALNCFKNAAVICAQYETASKLRELEKSTFHSEEIMEELKYAKEKQTYYKSIDVHIPLLECWKLGKLNDGLRLSLDTLVKVQDAIGSHPKYL